ncbi:protein NUCLEAR FUSION DEFECTIVE 6 chloroplastic/mitochondrial-like [Prunus yedoensis var. nudiflora]|uniref:Protein NUCLEAR FUSION DEFECTIVE 6 chloroplastic/mitochondrial-like n=1 Tax=Prunus yedoensis var. nudiflora TaxID=2094558 RepID=A0A314XS10_PRUYE|nr:protein NUCLEAR FUSION DEFECTIVE 6 chloroplastic/mitochondrial-like [Prunus yedoensis var. nudiflora]
MAANCARRTLQFSSSSAKTLLCRTPCSPFASKASNLIELTAVKPTLALDSLLRSSRFPVELAGAQSLIPMHSATASALFTSLLSLHNNSWGCLSEGFATPL